MWRCNSASCLRTAEAFTCQTSSSNYTANSTELCHVGSNPIFLKAGLLHCRILSQMLVICLRFLFPHGYNPVPKAIPNYRSHHLKEGLEMVWPRWTPLYIIHLRTGTEARNMLQAKGRIYGRITMCKLREKSGHLYRTCNMHISLQFLLFNLPLPSNQQ